MVKQKKNRARRAPKRTTFGAVSSITTAPVSIGNSVRGSKPRIQQTVDGARVVGRDFAFGLSGTASTVTNWELIGGMPVTPCVLPSSVLRNYCQMFQFFKVNKVLVHYITSSATSQTGDVVFYYERDRNAPAPDYSNSNFLPYILSDEATIIGPQWMNHTALINPPPEWKSTLYGNQPDLNEDAAGTVFMFSKTSTTSSPGYILIDYDISFKSMAVNPRAGSLPIARGQSNFICLTNTTTTSSGATAAFTSASTGKNISNVTSSLPTGDALGDIYKLIVQATASQQVNATWTGTPAQTLATLLQYQDNTAIALDDGFTCFMRQINANSFVFYSTPENAVTDTGRMEWQIASVSPTVNLCCEIQLVRSVDGLTQSAY
nr:MAG: hypothetical protein 3 [Luteoviridae sp.]